MEESPRWVNPHQHKELQQMGRGPGVRSTSATSIQIDFVYQGIRCRERLRLAPTPKNIKYAQRLKATIDHEIATRTFDYGKHFPGSPRARKFAGSAGLSLKTAVATYLASIKAEIEPETLEEYEHDAAICIAGLGDDPLGTYSRARLRAWVSSLLLSKKRIDNLLIPLRGTFKQALEDEAIDNNPLEAFKVKRVRREKDFIDPFTRKEIEALAKTDLGYLWEFWAWTGLRSGEIIGLRESDLERNASSIAVRRAVRVGREKRPKTERGNRVLHLLRPAREALKRKPRSAVELNTPGNDPLFRNPNTGERWHEDRALARAFRNACKAAGVRYRYPYQLRHTFASWALSSGENPLWVATQMGHADVTMIFKVYGKYMPSMNPDAGRKMLRTKAA